MSFLRELIDNSSKLSSLRFIFILIAISSCIGSIFILIYSKVGNKNITWEDIALITTMLSIATGGKIVQKKIEKGTENNLESDLSLKREE